VAGERLVGGEGDGAVGADEGRVSGWARGRKGSLMVACLPIALVLSFEDGGRGRCGGQEDGGGGELHGCAGARNLKCLLVGLLTGKD
jgi:hypothetical protein